MPARSAPCVSTARPRVTEPRLSEFRGSATHSGKQGAQEHRRKMTTERSLAALAPYRPGSGAVVGFPELGIGIFDAVDQPRGDAFAAAVSNNVVDHLFHLNDGTRLVGQIDQVRVGPVAGVEFFPVARRGLRSELRCLREPAQGPRQVEMQPSSGHWRDPLHRAARGDGVGAAPPANEP